MKEQFVPYEQALGLKELGFDEKCLCYYVVENKRFTEVYMVNHTNKITEPNSDGSLFAVKAPLWQQAFDWFRDKGLVVQLDLPDYTTVEGFDDLVYYFKISDYDGWRGGLRNTYKSVSYDTLEEERIECLKELIQILKRLENI